MGGFPMQVTTSIQPCGSRWTARPLSNHPHIVLVEIDADRHRITVFLDRGELDQMRSALDEASLLLDAAAAPAA